MADLTYEQAEKIKDEWLSLFEQYPDLPRNPRMEQWASWHQKHTGVDYSLIISGPQALDYLRQHARKEQPEEEKKEEKDKHRHSETGEEKTEETEKKGEEEKNQEQEAPLEDAEKTKKALEGYGKDQKPVEDKTHRAEGPTALEAASQLEQIVSAPAITPRLIVAPEAPVEEILRPMRAESQTKKYQELQKEQAFNPKPSLNEKLLNDPFFKQAEDDLRNEYGKKYEDIKKTLLEEKQADYQETYKEQEYHTEAGNKIPMADYMLEQYELGKIRHRGMDIETQLERDARNRFRELYQKEWHREQQTKPAEGSVGKPLYIPGHATFTAQEVTERYKQLYPKEYGQNYGEPERETLGTAEDMQPLQKEAAKEAAFFRSLGEKLGATDLSTELKASTERHPGEEPPATSPSKETTEEPLPTTQGLTTGRAAIKDVAPVVIQEHGAQSLEDNNRTKEAPTQVGGETKYSRAKAIREGLERLRAINEEARELSERKRAKTIIDQEPLSVAPRGVQESPRIEEPQFFRPSSQPQATPIVSQGGQPGGLFTRAINGGNNLGRNLFRGRPLGGFGRGLPGGLGQAGRAASQLLNVAKTASFLSNPAVLGSITAGIFIAIVLAILMGWIILPGGTGGIQIPSAGGDIASCTFYRGGDTTQGYKFRIPEWPALINDVSSKVGVPASIVAGILRVETSDAFYKSDPTYITNDVDDHFSRDENGNPVAYGVMQFTPGTFKETFEANRAEMQSLFGKTEVSNKLEVDSLADVEPSNLLRIYSVRDSVIATAFKVKTDKKSINGNGPWDETTVREIAKKYFSGNNNICNYSQNGRTNSYCDDLWKSYSGCVTSSAITACASGSSASGAKTVVLNPGHAINPTDPELGGAAGEAEKNTELAKKIRERLRAKNYQAFLARPDENGIQTFNPANRYDDYQQRIDFANDYNDKNPNGGPADLFVEIHFDAGAGGPYSFYSDRRIIVDSAGTISPNPNTITPNVDQWIAGGRKINTLITKKITEAIKNKYNTTYQSDREIADHACIGRTCGGHLFTIGPQGTRSNPERPESIIQRENQAVSAYIETLGMSNPYANDLDLLADAYTDAIVEYLGTSPSAVTASCASSCPLQGARVISCGSFMSDPKFNVNRCSGPQPIDRGHCGLNYGCYKKLADGTSVKMTDPTEISNSRRSHAIDVNGQPGDKVKLPTINGNVVEWNYDPSLRYPVAPGDGGGYGHVFVANVGGDRWELHLLHTKPPPAFPIPVPAGKSRYQSGDEVTEIEDTGFPHVHINLGKNPEGNNGGSGWLNPEGLGMCVNL